LSKLDKFVVKLSNSTNIIKNLILSIKSHLEISNDIHSTIEQLVAQIF